MEFLAEHCAGIFVQHRFILVTFFLAGLTGGFTHCISMCGPFMACQTACTSSSCSKKNTIIQSLNIKYHLGRATTYGALGFLSALFTKQIASSPIWPWISAFMLVLAGMMFLVGSTQECKHSLGKAPNQLTYLKGALLGFLPCGLIYAALMMAATTANPFIGMFAMVLFVIGTTPSLFLANWGIKMLTDKWQDVMQKIGRSFMVFNGLALFVMAIKLVR